MRIVVCDDNYEEAVIAKEMLEQYLNSNRISADIFVITEPEKVRELGADILILDVEMPGLDGITLKNQLAVEKPSPLIIFATNDSGAISRAFNKNVIGFLLKPLRFDDLSDHLELAMVHLHLNRDIALENDRVVNTGDIVFIEADNGYTVLHLSGGRTSLTERKTMEYWEEELKDSGFLRIDKGHIVNNCFIESFRDDKIVLNETDKEGNMIRFTASRRKKKECKQQYQQYCNKVAKYV